MGVRKRRSVVRGRFELEIFFEKKIRNLPFFGRFGGGGINTEALVNIGALNES